MEEVSVFIAPSGRRVIIPVSRAQQEATARYEAKVYDKVLARLLKGHKAEIQAHAEVRDESVNGFIGRVIDETMERDNAALGVGN